MLSMDILEWGNLTDDDLDKIDDEVDRVESAKKQGYKYGRAQTDAQTKRATDDPFSAKKARR